jgi:hypothetical protein
MKIQGFDALDEDGGRKLSGHKVIDQDDESIGTLDGVWMDPSTHRVAFVGVKTSWFPGKVLVVPAGDVEVSDEGELIKIRYPAAFVRKAPSFFPESELAEVEKEEVNACFGRFLPIRRVSSLKELRPEEAADLQNSEQQSEAEKDRLDLERGEQTFFDQKGFVTDSMPEVNASQDLLRTQEEAKVRNRENRIKEGSLD